MIILRAPSNGHQGYFDVVVQGGDFNSYIRVIKAIPSREWVAASKVWRISIHDYDLLREDCLKANLRYIEIEDGLKTILANYKKWEQDILDIAKLDDCEIPINPSLIRGRLMPHQRVAVKFMLHRGIGINGSEMGVGKTFPSLVVARHLYDKGLINSCLVVCITPVKYNWVREIQKCLTDEVTFRVIEGTPDKRVEGYFSKALFKIVNYEIIRNDIDTILYDTIFDCIIVDEIHRIRTYSSKQTKALYQLGKKATYRFGLTGTPVQNKLTDLHSIMRFIHPNLLGNWFVFDQRYIEHGYFGETIGHKNLEEVHKKLKTIMIRHMKSDVLKELPPKVYNDVYIDLSKEQRKFYNQVRDNILQSQIEEVEDKVRQANILANITYLREVCDSCELIDPEVHSSVKMKELGKIVEELISNGHKVVVFSQFERMTRIIERDLKLPAIRLHGGISTQDGIRDKMQDDFRDSKTKNVFIMTTAGGEGINLQCADYIIFFDLPFNPQVINQVEDRLHRKGQLSTVNVIKLIAKDTVEDRVLEILKFKTKLFKEVIDGVSSETGMLTQKELLKAI